MKPELLLLPERFPRSSTYDPVWVLSLDMGPNPLWQLEELWPDLYLKPGQRVLDIGSGRGATAVFLAREAGVSVDALDLWVSAEAAGKRIMRPVLTTWSERCTATCERWSFLKLNRPGDSGGFGLCLYPVGESPFRAA